MLPANIEPSTKVHTPPVPSRLELELVVLVSLIATAPVWIPYYPMMTDLPQHSAQVALMHNVGRAGFPFSSLFVHHWFTPYLFGYLAAYAMSPVLGVVMALKVVIAAALALMPISTWCLAKQVGADRRWFWITIPALYGFTYQWGFMNFLIAAPLGIFFLVYVDRYVKKPSARNAWILVAFVNVLFFSHALICGFFGLIALLYILHASKTFDTAWRRVLPLASVLPVMMLYMVDLSHERFTNGKRLIWWDLPWWNTTDLNYRIVSQNPDPNNPGWGRISGFLPRLLGSRPSMVCTIVGLLIFLLPLLGGTRFTRRVVLWIPLICVALALLLLPHSINLNTHLYQRMTMFTPALYLLVLERRPDSQNWMHRFAHVAVAGVAIFWLGVICLQARVFNADQMQFRQVMRFMKPGERALSMVFDRDFFYSIAPVYIHFPAWYSGEKDGIVDPSGAGWSVELIRFRADKQPLAMPTGFEWQPIRFDWKKYNGEQYRYFVIRSNPENEVGNYQNLREKVFASAPCTVRPIVNSGEWWVYERGDDCLAAH